MSDEISDKISDRLKELIDKEYAALKEKSKAFFAMRAAEQKYHEKKIIFYKIEDQLMQAMKDEE